MYEQSILSFLKDLSANNTKEWFEDNKKRYEIMKEAYHDLAGKLLIEMKKADPTLQSLEVKNCVFRIHKDVRFSKDKSPYKTALGMIFTPFGKKMQLGGYYLHLEDNASFAGGGLYMPPNDLVKKIRSEMINFKEDFLKIVNDKNFVSTYSDLDKSPQFMLVKPPKDVSPDDPIADYLRLKSFTTGKKVDNKSIDKGDFIKNCTNDLMVLHDMVHFLNRGIMSDENGGL